MTRGLPDIQIDSIAIRAPGVERDTARRLGELIASGLAGALRLGPGEAATERLQLELTSDPGEPPEALAARVSEQLALLIGNTGLVEAGR